MIELITHGLAINFNGKKLKSLSFMIKDAAKDRLSKIWDANISDLNNYLVLLYDEDIKELSDSSSFVTVSFVNSGYILDANEVINIEQAKKQIEIDLEIINKESGWSKKESIYFNDWWPKPNIDKKKHIMEFGVSLKDFQQKVFNRTINRIVLVRYGYLSINYSLSEYDIVENKPLLYYQNKLDEIISSIDIKKGYRFKDINIDSDIPSKSRMINLLLSSEIF